jgi:hypothetical protein
LRRRFINTVFTAMRRSHVENAESPGKFPMRRHGLQERVLRQIFGFGNVSRHQQAN